MMKKIFKNTLNTRQILPNNNKYIRSDVPTTIIEEEKEWLLENNITTIVDLRTDEERDKKECPLIKDARFHYYCMPVTGGNAIPESVEDVSLSYVAMVDEQLNNTIDFMLNNQSNILYFCNAGKDRTGVVSAILLWKSGMSIEYIIEDYMKSKTNLGEMLESFARQNPEVDINVITPHERYMREFMEEYIKNAEQEKVCLVTERLVLLPHGTKYIETTHEYAIDLENTKYMISLPSDSLEATRSFLESCEAEWNNEKPSFLEFAILKDKVQIGSIGLYFNESFDAAEIGWILARDYHNYGYATEAAKAAMNYAKEQLGLTHFIAHCDSENTASENVMKKIGMTKVSCYGGRKNKGSDEERQECLYEVRLRN